MKAKPKTIDEYLANVSEDKRVALHKLRKSIQTAAPKAEECISYGLAAFRLDGKPLVAFGATANHCAFYPMSSATVDAHQAELKSYDTSKGTIRFAPDKPLPTALVKKLVKARIAENQALAKPEPTKKKRAQKQPNGKQFDPNVIAFLDALEHPFKSAILAVRQIILDASPEIREGIKWNSPSFRTTEYFATLNLRGKNADTRVWLILHSGAKVKEHADGWQVADPTALLEWLAKDRCRVTFHDVKDVATKSKALQVIVRAWIRQL